MAPAGVVAQPCRREVPEPPAGTMTGSPRGNPEGKGAWATGFDPVVANGGGGACSGITSPIRDQCPPTSPVLVQVAQSRHGGRSVERPLLDYPTGTRMSARHPFGFPQESVEPKATGKTRDRGAPKERQGRNEEGNHTPEPNRSREREVAPASHPLSGRG